MGIWYSLRGTTTQLRMNPESRCWSLPEEHVDAARQLKALAFRLSGGIDHPLDDFGAEGFAV